MNKYLTDLNSMSRKDFLKKVSSISIGVFLLGLAVPKSYGAIFTDIGSSTGSTGAYTIENLDGGVSSTIYAQVGASPLDGGTSISF